MPAQANSIWHSSWTSSSAMEKQWSHLLVVCLKAGNSPDSREVPELDKWWTSHFFVRRISQSRTCRLDTFCIQLQLLQTSFEASLLVEEHFGMALSLLCLVLGLASLDNWGRWSLQFRQYFRVSCTVIKHPSSECSHMLDDSSTMAKCHENSPYSVAFIFCPFVQHVALNIRRLP